MSYRPFLINLWPIKCNNKQNMSEIITIGIGQAGSRIAYDFIQKLSSEHAINTGSERGRASVFFEENQKHYESRSLFMSHKAKTLDQIRSHQKCSDSLPFLKPKNLIQSPISSDGTFGHSMYSEQSHKIVQSAMEMMRIEVEKCDKLSGFLLVDSLGGGSSSGLSSKLFTCMNDEFGWGRYVFEEHSILPDTEVYTPLHAYNLVHSIHYKIEHSTVNTFYQNKAFYNRLKNQQCLHPSIDQLNDSLAQGICELTAPYRFPGTLNTNQRKICTDLIMFPRLKFMLSSYSELDSSSKNPLQDALNAQNFGVLNFLLNQSETRKEVFTVHLHSRNRNAYEEQIYTTAKSWAEKNDIKLCEWITNTFHMSNSEAPEMKYSRSCALFNTSHYQELLKKWAEIFTSQFRRKAFICQYTKHGMDEMQFTEAESNMNDLVSEYCQYNGSGMYDEEDEWENYGGYIEE